VADYEIIYRATADFASLMSNAAKARATLKDLQDSAREEGQAETDAAVKAAAAHDADTAAIKRQRDAMVSLAAASKAANKETAFGGRDSMQAHLGDLDSERQKEDLLNRTRWGGMSNPQSWEAWQQQVYQHQILRNKESRQGYATPDQYLSYLDQERSRTSAQTEAVKGRASAMEAEARALQAHNDALRQTHESAGTLGTSGAANIQGYQAALAGLPDKVVTAVSLDARDAERDLTTYHLGLSTTPSELTTTAKLETGQFLSELARIKGLLGSPGISPAGGASFLMPSAAADVQRGMAGFTEQHTYGRGGPSGMMATYPHEMTSWQRAAAQLGISNLGAQPGEQLAMFPAGPAAAAAPGPVAQAAAVSSQVAGQMALPFQQPHEGLADKIRQQISAGTYAAGEKLPAKWVMGQQLGTGPATLTKALALLHQSGDLTLGRGGYGVPSGPPQAPVVTIGGVTHALTDVSSIKAALTDLSRVVANPRVELNAGEAQQALRTIQGAMKDVSRDYTALGGRPQGFSDLAKQLSSVQEQAVRSFDEVEQRGGRSADTLAGKWSALKGSLSDVFRTMAESADDAAEHTERTFATSAERIAAAFRGVGATGLGDVFKNLASVAATAGSQVIGSIAPMIATFITLVQLLPALVAGFGALSTVFAAMPESVAAVATVMATLKMAIGPVVEALQAYAAVLAATQSAAANPLQTSMQLAQMQNQLANAYYEVGQAAFQAQESQVQNAHAVTDAQFTLSQAVINAANQQVVAAHAVLDAQFEVAQANFQQSIQQVESAMSVAEAQHSLADAVFATGQAQYQLDIAWQTASEDLANLMIQVDYASVNLRGAQLALEQAQQNYAQTMANSNATALDRAQAAYQIQAAEEALAEQEQQNKDTETQLTDVRKYGANQVFGVTQAEHELTDAQFAQVEAQKQLMVTQREAANAQVEAAHAIEDAVFSLQQAYFEQSQSAITGAHDVADAQFGLSQAQIEQGEGFITSSHDQQQAAFQLQQAIDQMALGLPSVASAEENLATAMFKLGPAARTAVLDLEPLAKWLVTNKNIGQAFFSQMLPSLGRVGELIKPLNSYLTANASELGMLANQALTWFERLANSSAWKVLTGSEVIIVHNLGEAVGYVVQGFTKLAIVAAPFTEWLTRGVEKLAEKFDTWATNADKSGSNFRRWLTDVRPALHDMGQVVKAIVDGFAIIAGGPMGSQGSLDSLKTFEQLMHELSTTILPNVFTFLHALSSPEMASALIKLFGALSQLLLVVVSTPGFQAGFQLSIRLLTGFLDVLTAIARSGPVGNIIGAIAGAVVALGAALAIAKFSGILSLINNFKTLAGWAQNAYGWVRKVLGLDTAEAGKGPAATTPDSITSAGDTAAETIGTAMKEAGDVVAETIAAAIRGGGEVAAGEQGAAIKTAGEEAAAEEGTGTEEGAAAGGGLLGAAGSAVSKGIIAVLVAQIIDSFLKNTRNSQGNWLDNPFGTSSGPGGSGWNSWPAFWKNIAGGRNTTAGAPTPSGTLPPSMLQPAQASAGWVPGAWDTSYQHFQRDFAGPLTKFFTVTLPSLNTQAGNAINRGWMWLNTQWLTYVQDPVANFLTSTLPGFFTATIPAAAAQGWNAVWLLFTRGLLQPVENFFTDSVPAWLDSVVQGFGQAWSQGWELFTRYLLQPAETFFTATFGGWMDVVGRDWSSLWDTGWSNFGRYVISPAEDFFTKTVPGWFTDLGHDFTTKVASPLGTFFTTTLPRAIEDDFKSAVNFVITNVINKAIGFVNDVTHVVGVPAIKKVQTLATGGHVASVAGSGDEDSVHAMLTPGEYIIRKPARMAIDSQMGPAFLPSLNAMQGYAGGGSVQASGDPLTAITGDIGSFLGSAGKSLENLLGGGVKSVEGLLGKGADVLFDKVWSSAVTPLASRVLGSGAPGSVTAAVAQAVLGDVKKGIDKYLTGSGFTGPAPHGLTKPVSSAQVAAEESYALSQFGKYGWAPSQMPYLIDNWNLESGWNPLADNPSSGAYGIPQSLPASKMGPLANPPTSSYVAQINWGLNYIKGRYGSPEASDAHEHEFHWYYTGGDVVSAAKQATSNQRYREAMLLGARLATQWNPNYDHGKRYGAWGIDKSIDPSVTVAHAKDPFWAARYMLPAYEHAVEHYGWKALPQDAAMAAAMAERTAESYYSAVGSGGVNAAWGDVLKALGIKTQVSTSPPGVGGTKPGGLDEATVWANYAKQLNDRVGAERSEFSGLYSDIPRVAGKTRNAPMQKALKVGSKPWAQWYAMELILAAQQEKVLSSASTSDWTKLWANVGNPMAMSESQWTAFASGVSDMEKWEAGSVLPPRSAWAAEKTGKWPRGMPWKVGDIEPSVASMSKYDNALWKGVRTDLLDIQTITGEAEKAWKSLYGPGGSLVPHTVSGPPTPGPGTPPAAAFTATPDYTAAILGYASAGGPQVPAFAAGGPVPDFTDFTPVMSQPGMNVAARGLSEGAQATGAGTHVGFQVNGGINVTNPVPERASDSIAHSVNRLAFLHGRGVA
jgi:hypothetical protein